MYAAADAFVLPSLKEPYGTVYGEAMAFGLPVVGWRAGNLPYLADHEREGLLVEPGDLRGLAAALQRLADDADLRARLGAAARQRALSRPTWDEVAGAVLRPAARGGGAGSGQLASVAGVRFGRLPDARLQAARARRRRGPERSARRG